LDDLERLLDAGWDDIDFGARWYAANQRAKAMKMLARLVDWLRDSRRNRLQAVAVEQGFTVEVGDAVLRGQVDRLERDADGRLVVVDYKTGTTRPKAEDVPRHPQLAAYQLAVERGAFGAGERSGGAMLVQLGGSSASYAEQAQPPLADSDDPEWIADTVADIAARMHGAEFTARIGDGCRNCDLKKCCPLQPDGRQVTR
jgi:RecB family exonuclease